MTTKPDRRSTPVVSRAKKGLRVLVIEDNEDSAETLRLFLELSGYEVSVAHSGPEGLKRAAAWRPTTVLSDIGLPGLDGWEVAKELRRHPATAQARLIAITGYGDDDSKRRAREAGYDHFLTKPADPETLLRLIKS